MPKKQETASKDANKPSPLQRRYMKKAKVIDYKIGDMYGLVNPKRWKQKWAEFMHKKYLFLVVMQLRNGSYDMFTVATKTKFFERHGGTYVIDPDMARKDNTSRLDVYFYHQDMAAPFKIDFDFNELYKKLDNAPERVKKALNPTSFKEFFTSSIIEMILKGGTLSKDVKFLKMMAIVNIVISAGILLILIQYTGILG